MGVEYLDNNERVILIPNHISFLDVALLTAFVPRSLTFAIDANWSKVWWVKLITRFFSTIPINPALPMSLRELIKAVHSERTLVIFPEGRITTTGSIMKIHDGPGLIAVKSEAAVVPIIFEGLEYTRFGRLRNLTLQKPCRIPISMTIFPPQKLDPVAKPKERRQSYRRRLTEDIYEILAKARFKARFNAPDSPQNLWLALLEASKKFGSSRLIIEDLNRKPLSYDGLIRRSRVLCRFLAAKTQPGEKVGVLLPNTNALAVVLFGLWAGGRIPVVLNYSRV